MKRNVVIVIVFLPDNVILVQLEIKNYFLFIKM